MESDAGGDVVVVVVVLVVVGGGDGCLADVVIVINTCRLLIKRFMYVDISGGEWVNEG